MWAYARDTLHGLLRRPATWGLCALGLLAGLAARELSILALGGAAEQAPALRWATAQAWAVLLVLWTLAQALEQDAAAGSGDMLDATRPGRLGRLLGRWGGACAGGALLSTGLGLGLAWADTPARGEGLYLLVATFWVGAHVGAWGLLLGRAGHSVAVLAGGLGLWVLGHVPPPVAGGGVALLWRGLLPHALPLPLTLDAWGATALAAGGTLALALAAWTRPAARRGPCPRAAQPPEGSSSA